MRRFFIAAAGIIIAAVLVVLGLNAYVTLSARDDIVATDKGAGTETAEGKFDCILVLGCAVWADNQPSPMLRDRLDTAIALYKGGAAPKLLLSGDNRTREYSEPDCMLQYALKAGVAEEDIFLDYAGLSTYDSVYRAKNIFGADKIIIVTQTYHLYRALYDSRALGLRAKGAASDQRRYSGRLLREIREVMARDKDMVKCIFKPASRAGGEEIDIHGDGSATHVNDY